VLLRLKHLLNLIKFSYTYLFIYNELEQNPRVLEVDAWLSDHCLSKAR